MSTDYAPPDPAIAEMVYRDQVQSDEQHRRLEHVSAVQLKAVVRCPKESQVARLNALLFLLTHREPEMPEILLELFHDPDQELWRSVIRSYCPADTRITAKLRSLLDNLNERNWSEAAWALARSKDTTLLPRLADWLGKGDRSHRNVAIECLKALDVPEARRLLRDFGDQPAGGEEDRLVVGAALLSLGDTCGLGFLESNAQRAQGSWSVFAATSIYHYRSRHGLELMLRILDEGDLEAKQSMVNQIWNYADLPHAFTADGIHEAHVWIETQLGTPAI